MRIYIAGPMTGKPQMNFPLFNTVATQLREQGHEVVNPAEMEDHSRTLTDIIKQDIEALLTCDAIMMLPEWEWSPGAKAELAVAKWAGLTIRNWLHEQMRHEAITA